MAQSLNDLMEFDHPIRVHEDGTISEPTGIYAPEVYDGETLKAPLVEPGWELVNGFSGQYGYSGPVMHPSEFIGGRLEDRIRETPGVYVVVEVRDGDEYPGGEPVGWAVARKIED
jgi:hypothetical protein